jgi:hypothetical protein
MSGCLIAFLVFCGIAALGVAFIVFFVYRFSQSDDGKKLFETIGDAKAMYEKAVAAPGVKEARAAGCTNALVFDLKDAGKLGQKFGEKADAAKDLPAQLMLICSVQVGDAPTCPGLAATYHKAPGASAEPIFVAVTRPGDEKPECRGLYDAGGKQLPTPKGLD